jgi:hypothetical protein
MTQSYVSIAELEIQIGQSGLPALANIDSEEHDCCRRGSAKYER